MAYYNNLSDEEIQELKELFSSFVKDSDGVMTLKDLRSAMKSRYPNLTEAMVQDFVNEADSTGKGTIDFRDFENIMALLGHLQRRSSCVDEEEIIDACKVFDKEGKGTISRGELKQILMEIEEQVTEEEVESFISEAEVDENGRINYEDFIRMMMAK